MSSLLLHASRCAFKIPASRCHGTRYLTSIPSFTHNSPCILKLRPWNARLVERRSSSSSTLTARLPRCCNFFTSSSSPLALESSGKATPDTTELPPLSGPAVTKWLFFSATLVFGIIVVGGITRLTESGLSIVEWRPVTGVLPPLSQQAWEEEFNKYKTSPEFKT